MWRTLDELGGKLVSELDRKGAKNGRVCTGVLPTLSSRTSRTTSLGETRVLASDDEERLAKIVDFDRARCDTTLVGDGLSTYRAGDPIEH